ncbi:hypothetical protein [Bradyrhizobium sp.]|uniref:hypothetical protein n=1 Tax=Bradyrhizobium sp. TaxID=376 RepID=UPI0026297C18|nr:hypothetical protein [Bradyrhizobium sp.]
MEKKIAGLLGAVATLGAVNASQAAPMRAPAPSDILKVNSFAELLEPIPNAAELLKIVDQSGPGPSPAANVQPAQYWYHHHHHHHHHNFYPRYGYPGYGYPGYGYGGVVVPRYPRYYHHHHHHHHHHNFYPRGYW